MEYVSEVADVVVGDLVVTSGIDGIYPKGFVIGRVESVEKSGGGVQADYASSPPSISPSLEEVLVVLTPTPAREAADGERRVRAAGIVLAVAAALALQTTLARYIRGTRGGRSGARRGRLRRADVGTGDRPADRDVRRAWSRMRWRPASSGSAGWPRRWSGFWPASSAPSSSWRSRCRGSWCFSARRCCTGWSSSGCTCCSICASLESPYAAVAGQAAGNAVVGRRGVPAGRAAARSGRTAACRKRPAPPVK